MFPAFLEFVRVTGTVELGRAAVFQSAGECRVPLLLPTALVRLSVIPQSVAINNALRGPGAGVACGCKAWGPAAVSAATLA